MVDEDRSATESLGDRLAALSRQQHDGNIDALRQELSQQPRDLVVHVATQAKVTGNELFRQGNYEAALASYDQSLAGDIPEVEKIHSNRSACYLALKRYDAAVLAGAKAVAAAPTWGKGYFRVGRAYSELKQWADAEQAFEVGAACDPGNKEMVAWWEKAKAAAADKVAAVSAEKAKLRVQSDYSRFEKIADPDAAAVPEQSPVIGQLEGHDVVAGEGWATASEEEKKRLLQAVGTVEAPESDQPQWDPRQLHEDAPEWDATERKWRVAPVRRRDFSDCEKTVAVANLLEARSEISWMRRMENMAGAEDQQYWADPLQGLLESKPATCLVVGAGTGCTAVASARVLLGTKVTVVTHHKAPFPGMMIKAVAKANGVDIAVQDGMVFDAPKHPYDCVVLDPEVLDEGLLGKGVLAILEHVHLHLAVPSVRVVPATADIWCCPIESPAPTGLPVDVSPVLEAYRWSAFYETLEAQDMPWRKLGAPQKAFAFDLEKRPTTSGMKNLQFVVERGVLHGMLFWAVYPWESPAEVVATGRAAVQWVPGGCTVDGGQMVSVAASHSVSRVRFQVTDPAPAASIRKYSLARWRLRAIFNPQRLKVLADAGAAAARRLAQTANDDPLAGLKMGDGEELVTMLCFSSGAGVLPILLAQASRDQGQTAVHVTGVEANGHLASHGKRLLQVSDVASCVELRHDDVRAYRPSLRHRLCVVDCFDCGLLGDGVLPLLEAAKKSSLRPGAQIIPSSARIWAVLVEELWCVNDIDLGAWVGAGEAGYAGISLTGKGKSRILSSPVEVLAVDFMGDNAMQSGEPRTIVITPTRPGKCTAVAFWYDLFLDSEKRKAVTTAPRWANPTGLPYFEDGFQQALQHLQEPAEVRDECVTLSVTLKPDQVHFALSSPAKPRITADTCGQEAEIWRTQAIAAAQASTAAVAKKTRDFGEALRSNPELKPDALAAVERVAVEPNGTSDYFIDPQEAAGMHLSFFAVKPLSAQRLAQLQSAGPT
mmetsp:Transcript_8172/g.17821  ORF Transcript_8172/g.17821 Transcript_8172/m.17821 type:complete len:997 (+) Transcript_8172:21-3011(+)